MGFRTKIVIFSIFAVLLGGALFHNNLSLPAFEMKPTKKYPSGVPDKFDLDGNVQRFPGNTIICSLREDTQNNTELYTSLLLLQDKIKKSPLAHMFALLPPSSYHMTVFEGVTDKHRKLGYWPSDLSLDDPLENCTAHFTAKLQSFNLSNDLPYRLSIVGFKPLGSGISLHIEPHTDSNQLRGLRDRLADLLNYRHPSHVTYRFHLSLAYNLRWLTDSQKVEMMNLLMDHFQGMPKEFELGAPEFCSFENMFAFEPILSLQNTPNVK